jgi:hypothetical protein
MASILKLNGCRRALIRNADVIRSKTFDTKGAASTWATKFEAEVEGCHATGKSNPGKVLLSITAGPASDSPWRAARRAFPHPWTRSRSLQGGGCDRQPGAVGRMDYE